MTVEHTAPMDTHAEQAVLGSALLDRDAIALIEPFLKADDFYHESHRMIYQAMLDTYRRRVPGDYVTIGALLRERGQLEQCGGHDHLISLAHVPATSYHVEWYANIVLETAQARMMIEVGRNIAALAYDSDERATLLDKSREMIERVERRAMSSDIHWAREISHEYIRSLDDDEPKGVATGLVDLDQHLVGGLHSSDLVLLAARTSIGKTTFALQVARNVAKRGETVLFLSLEMNRAPLWQRLIAMITGIDSTRIRQHSRLSQDELARVIAADGELSMGPLGIYAQTVQTVSALRSATLQAARDHGLPALLIIDYLNLLAPESQRKSNNRVNDIGEISRACKQLAATLNCPVLALAQLSRGVEQRQDGIPRLSDLRESGSLEQDADVVLFLDREEVRDPKSQRKGQVDVLIAKHRLGPLGKVTLAFQPETGRFRDYTGYTAPSGYGGPQ
jgi:replicative DNA helicase